MKFSYKLSVTIFTTGLIVLILLSFAIYQFNYHSVIKSQTEFTESIVNEISDDINHMFSEKIKIALTLANSNTIIQALEDSIASHADLPDEKRKESIKQLNEKWKSTKDSSDKFILEFTDNIAAQFLKRQQKLLKDEYGEIFFTNKFGALVASTSKLSTFSHGHKYWWMESYNNGKGKVFFDDRGYDDSVGGYVLGLVVPIKKGTQIIGILKCNLSILGSISELISDAEHKLFGNFKLTRSGGRVVFEEGFEPLSTQIHDNLFKQLKNNDHGSIIIDDFKEKYLVGFSQIKLTKDEIRHGFGGTFESVDHKKGNKGESWYVLCYRRMSIIQALINKPIKSIFLMGITILIILLLVSYLFGEKIARPLTALNKATQKIGKRDFDYEIDISQNDEFGILAHSFKVMSDKLQKTTTSIDNLENEIGERKKAEYALKNNQKFLNSVIYQSPFATWISDEKGTIIKCNAALEKLLNITEEQLIGKYNVFEDKIAIEQGLIPKIRTVFEHGKTANISVEWDAKKLGYKDANKVYIEGTMFPIYNDKGDLTNVVNHWIDTTKRKQAEKAKTQLEAQLHQSQKMESIGTLAGGIAHDFNNILFPIVGHSEMLMEDIPEDSPFQENLQEIYTASLRAKGLVKQILTFSRQKRIDLKLIKIQPIIKEALKLIRSTIPTTINIKQYIKKDCGIIKADPIQIHQVVMNLATNAYQAMEKTGGDLIIRLEEVKLSKSDIVTSDIMPGIYNFLIVSDTGKGMDKKLVEKIFDPFFTTKGKSKGTGMGLSVVHGIIKSMNGFITVYSKPDKGTEFHIYLPVVKNPSKTQKVHQMKHPIQGGIERILLVDDENSVVIIVKQMLERLGYQVTSRTSSTEALEAFRAEPDKFDLVISDFAMPNMPGDKLASKLTKIRPNIPILLCTGFSETLTEEKAVSMGINGFLMKPVVMKDLSEKIRDMLN